MRNENMCGIVFFGFAALILHVSFLKTDCFQNEQYKDLVGKYLEDFHLADKNTDLNNDMDVLSDIQTKANTEHRLIQELKSSLSILINEVKILQDRLKVQDVEIIQLKSDNKKIVDLETSVNDLNLVVENLHQTVAEQDRLIRKYEVDRKFLDFENSINQLSHVVDGLKIKLNVQLGENKKLESEFDIPDEDDLKFDTNSVTMDKESDKIGQTITTREKAYNNFLIDETSGSKFMPTKELPGQRHPNFVRNERLLPTGAQHVAFSSYLDHNIPHIAAGDVVKCNQILYSAGNGYNPHTGIFTAPDSGVYFFTFSIHNYHRETNVRLVLDGNNVVGAVIHTTSGDIENNMASNSAIIQVNAGQSVWLEQVLDADAELISLPDYREVTFTGFRLN